MRIKVYISYMFISFLVLSTSSLTQTIVNLVPNPGFEEGKNYPEPWIIHHLIKGDWAQYSSAEWATDEVHSGKRSIKVTVTKSAGRTLGWRISEENPIPIKGGKKVKVSGWMKTRNIVMGPTEYDVPSIIFVTYDVNKKVVKRYWIGRATKENTEWTKYEKVIHLKDEVEYFTLSAGLSNCTGTAWFDDFEVVYEDSASFMDYIAPLLTESNKEEDIPIIIPQPYKELYGKQKFFLSKPAILVDGRLKNGQIEKELDAFLKETVGSSPSFIPSEKEMGNYETVIIIGKSGSSKVATYLKQLNININWKELGPQGYLLVVKKYRDKNVIVLSGNTEQGIYYALQTLKQYPIKKGNVYQMIEGVILDKPEYLWRGLVPGSTSLTRIDRWMVPLKVNVIYGVPGIGSYEWWRQFDTEYKDNLKKWVEECKKRFIIPVAGERPDRGYVRRIKFSDRNDISAILQRYKDYYECGIKYFKLAFDDGLPCLEYPEDKAIFKNIGEAHYYLAYEVYNLLKGLNPENHLSICPLYYYNPLEWSPQQKKYIKTLSQLPEEVVFINSSAVTKESAEEFIHLTGRKPLIWDNWVAQFETMKPIPSIVPPPCTKNDKDLSKYTQGYMFPMLDKEMMWYLASDYMWNGSRYNPEKSTARIMKKMFGEDTIVKLQRYQKFISTHYHLPIKGTTKEEKIQSVKNLINKFNQNVRELKGKIPDDLFKEIEDTAKNKVELLEKVFFPQIEKKPLPVMVPSTNISPVIDGKLDDICWENSVKLKGFYQPLLGKPELVPPKEQTEVMIMYDQNNLYVGFLCHEFAISNLKANMKERDSAVYRDDCVEIMLGVSETPDEYYHFAINSLGTIYDAKLFDEKWNSEIIVQTDKQKEKWTVEIAIPFKSLGENIFKGKICYFNMCRERYTGEKPEFSSWAIVMKSFHEPERFWILKLN